MTCQSSMNSTETQSILIDSSCQSVWRLLTTLADIGDWYDNWDTAEHDEPNQQHIAHGSRFRLIRERPHGQVESVHCRVTVFEPPRRLGWIEDGPQGQTVLVDFRLDENPTGGAVLTLSKHF